MIQDTKQRYFIELTYNGSRFHGWQIQPNAITVQAALETGLSTICREPIAVTGAGRTDTGVHASYYVAHFESVNNTLDHPDFVFKLNRFLCNDIAIFKVTKVPETAHARFDAMLRTYHYNVHLQKNPFLQETSWYFPKQLGIERMNEAAQLLYGQHDFTSFSKLHTDVKTNICTIHEALWTKNEHRLIFKIKADRFLRNMVRAIVGTLIDVGLGKLTNNDVIRILEVCNRCEAGVSVPAHGLFLTDITYPEEIFKHCDI